MVQLLLPGFEAHAGKVRRRRRAARAWPGVRSWVQQALDFAAPVQPPSVFGWMAQQALHAASSPAQTPKRRNTGMRRDSDTRRVLALLHATSGQYVLHRQIRKRLGLRKSSLDWALHYLRRIGLVVAAPFQPAASRPVLRYRLAACLEPGQR